MEEEMRNGSSTFLSFATLSGEKSDVQEKTSSRETLEGRQALRSSRASQFGCRIHWMKSGTFRPSRICSISSCERLWVTSMRVHAYGFRFLA